MSVTITSVLASGATGAATNATASYTPDTTAQYLLAINSYISTGSVAPTITGVSGNGVTWTLILGPIKGDNTGADRTSLWVYVASGSGGSAGAITITWGTIPGKASWCLDKVAGADAELSSGLLPQSAVSGTSSAANPSATLANALKSGSASYAVAGYESNSGTVTAGSGYAQLAQVVTQSFAWIISEWNSSGSKTASAANSVTTNLHAIILIEIHAAAVPVTLTNTLEGISSGTALTGGSGGNSGGVSGNFIDSVTVVAGGTLASDSSTSAHGLNSLQIATGSTAGNSIATWSSSLTDTAIPTAYFRQYLKFSANPAATHRILTCLIASGGAACSFWITNTGKIQARNAASTVILTSTASIPTGAWFRIEGLITGDVAAGQLQFKLFTTMDSTTAAETSSLATGLANGGHVAKIQFGIGGSAIANVGPFWMDDLSVSTSGWIGPVITGTVSIAMHKMGLVGTGSEKISGTGSIAIHKLRLSGSGTVTSSSVTGTGSISVHKLGLSGSGIGKVSATGSVRVHKLGLSGSGIGKVSATGSIRIHKLGLSGSGIGKVSATGSIRVHKLGLSGSGIGKVSATGSIRIHKLGLSGSGIGKVSATGSIRVRKLILNGTGQEILFGTGSVSLRKMNLYSAGIEKLSGSGSIAFHKMTILATNIRPHSSNMFIFTAV